MNTNINKLIALGVLVALTGAQCWGAAHDPIILNSAVAKGDLAIIREMLLIPGVDVNIPDECGFTPLMTAAMSPRPQVGQVMQALFDARADANQAGRNNWTPLILATKYNQEEAVQILLANGADKSIRDDQGDNALDKAMNNNNNLITEMLQ